MSFKNDILLSNGVKIPQIGYGTWLAPPKEVERGVEWAVRAGYRHLDFAMVYQNQEEVGAALKKVIPSVVKREELFITSKLWNTSHKPELVEKELDETLRQLGLDYLDLYLVHWPVVFPSGGELEPLHPTKDNFLHIDENPPSLVDTWKAMIALPKSKVRAIGVSNFTIEYIQGIIDATGVVPVVNQVEAHPLLPQDDLVAFCREKNIHITAYSPLGNNVIGRPLLVEHPVVQEVASRISATPAQVLIAWGAYRGYSVIPKSVKQERVVSNFQQVELSKEDYEKISSVGHNNRTRYNCPYAYKIGRWDINIFNEEAEKSASLKVKIR